MSFSPLYLANMYTFVFLIKENFKCYHRVWKNVHLFTVSTPRYILEFFLKSFDNFIPMNVIQNILNDKNSNLLLEEIVNDGNYEKSETEN